MFPEFHISPFSIGIVTIDVLFVYFIGYLLLLPRKSTATWYLIGFFSCIASVFFAFLIVYGTVEPGVARMAWRVLHVMVFGSVCLIQFAYHFPENRNPREARIVLIISALISAYGWGAYLYRTQNAVPVYVFEANSYNYFGIVEPGAIIGVQMVWAIVVLFRRAADLSDVAPMAVHAKGLRGIAPRALNFARRVAGVEDRYGRACRSFALIFIAPAIMVLSIPLAYLGYISWEVMAYFYTVGVIVGFVSVYLTYVANAPEPTTFLIKIVGISLAMLLVVLGFLGTLGVTDAEQAYDRARLREINVLRSRMAPLSKRDIPGAAAYIAKRGERARIPRFLFRAGEKPAALPAVASGLETRFFRKSSDADPRTFFIAYAFKQGDAVYEIGYPYVHYRRAIHASALTMTLGILASALFVSLFLPLFFRDSLVLPLRSLLGGVRRVNDGDLTVRVPVGTEDEIGFLSRSFNKMVNSVRRAYEIKDEFLANTSHELRTPLHGIIGIGESLANGAAGEVNSEQARNLAMMTASAKRLANLVNDILDFSRLKSREINLNRGPVDIHQVTAIVLAISRPLVAGKNITLVNAVPRDMPALDGDENRLQQIMHNLVGNAIKFTDEGEIRVEAEAQGDSALIAVRDTGIGIPADRMPNIFQPFEQGDAVVEKRFGGTGIGLSITRQLIDLHDGMIGVESEEGEGTTVSFTIPLSPESAPGAGETAVPESADALGRLRDEEFAIGDGVVSRAGEERKASAERKRVLIVDDEPLNVQVLVNILKLEDYEIASASDGREALAMLGREPPPDLILLDIMMPRMSGYEVCKRVRKRWSAVELPVILITARNQVADLVEGFNCGANDYLTKPVIRRELLARMETHLELARISEEHLRSQMRAADERRRVIGEVHDNIGSRIGAALMQAGEMTEAEPLRVLLRSALRNARDLASILNMNTMPERPWEADIRELAGTYEGILGFSMTVNFDPELNDCDLRTRLHVTRILQEWISNSMRHGRARTFELHCRARPERISIRLRTDGRPFAWNDRLPVASPGVGLQSIAERIHIMGGRGRSFAATRDEGDPDGTLLVIRLPRKFEPDQAIGDN